MCSGILECECGGEEIPNGEKVECPLGGEKPNPWLAREKAGMLSFMAFAKEEDMGGGEKNLGGGGDEAYAYGGRGDVAPDKL